MAHIEKLKNKCANEPMFGELTGASIIALQQAERYGTDLVIMENGKIVHISPQEMRKRLGLEPKH